MQFSNTILIIKICNLFEILFGFENPKNKDNICVLLIMSNVTATQINIQEEVPNIQGNQGGDSQKTVWQLLV